MVVAAFAAAPVVNPDEKPGIALHIDNGSGTVMDPKTDARWGALSRSNPLPHDDVLGAYGPGKSYSWTPFDEIKNRHFAEERRRIFPYVVFGHRYGSAAEDSSGLSRGFGASDLMVTLGGFCPGALECAGTVQEQAATLMHELGHNLNLRHGGDEDVNYKPNYLSIMSYRFQLPGLTRDGAAGLLDYSRFSPAGTGGAANTVAALDERALQEASGFGAFGAAVARYQTVYACRVWNGRRWVHRGYRTVAVQPGRTVDWNCNRRVPDANPVAVDINGDGSAGPLSTWNDWDHLVYEGGSIGAGGAARPLPASTRGGDAPVRQLVRSARIVLRDSKRPSLRVGRPIRGRGGRPVRIPIVARDNKGLGLLVLMIDRKSYQLSAKKGQRVLRVHGIVSRRGRRLVRIAVTDRAGNRSGVVTRRVVIR